MNTCTIRIPKLTLFGYHGCYDIEKTEGQEFEIDMEVKFSYEDENIADSDELKDTIDYVEIVKKVKEEFNKNRNNLLESLASRLADIPYQISCNKILASNIIVIKVRIKKYNPKGMDVPYVEVEYIRNYE